MQKKIIFWRTSDILGQLVLAIVLCGAYVLTSCSNEDNPTSEELFEEAMTAALADAHTYGPQTEAFAQEVATLFNGYVTDINYKTRESATRKCKTDNCWPYDLKDLARTTIVAGWDSIEIKPVIDYLVATATERSFFGRYKHQTSDYGYWGDIVNLKYEKLYTEIQVKTYGMFYASLDSATVTSVIGDSLYKYIHVSLATASISTFTTRQASSQDCRTATMRLCVPTHPAQPP